MTRLPTRAEIMVGLTAAAATLEQHNELMMHKERRVARAREKCAVADAELAAAVADHDAGAQARLQFIATNPDPQLVMPI